MAKYLSTRERELTIGVENYTEEKTVLTVVGNTNIKGNLSIEGDITINTEQFNIKDPLIELGLVEDPDTNELVPPTEDSGTDVGIVLHYYNIDEDEADTAALYFVNEQNRFKLASSSTIIGDTVVANAYAALEIGSLWINDCAGTSQVIDCEDGERFLTNISIDCGVYV